MKYSQGMLDFGFEPEQKEEEAPQPVVITTANEEVIVIDVPRIRQKPGRKKKEKTWTPQNPGKRGRKSFKEMKAEADLVEVPEDEVLFQKQYYSIGEVTTMFRANHSLIRMWCNEFDKFFNLKVNKKGDRFFRPEDVKTVQLIHFLIRQRKYTMEGAKEYLKNQKKKADEQFATIQSLKKIKQFLLEMKASMTL